MELKSMLENGSESSIQLSIINRMDELILKAVEKVVKQITGHDLSNEELSKATLVIGHQDDFLVYYFSECVGKITHEIADGKIAVRFTPLNERKEGV